MIKESIDSLCKIIESYLFEHIWINILNVDNLLQNIQKIASKLFSRINLNLMIHPPTLSSTSIMQNKEIQASNKNETSRSEETKQFNNNRLHKSFFLSFSLSFVRN